MVELTRRDFLKTVAAGAAAAALPFPFSFGRADAARKPNIIILYIDDLGYGDIGCFGNKNTPTPNMDALAAGGAKCTMSYITNPPCSPSRCAFITGMYVQRFGKSGMSRGLPIPKDHPTLAEFMRDNGYVTGQIGKWDIGDSSQGPEKRGFMEVAKFPGQYKKYMIKTKDGKEIYRTDYDGDCMVEFVERNKKKPFFLYFSPFAIHSPLKETPQHYKDRVKGGKPEYGGAVVAVDDQIGKLMEVLKKNGLVENTLIILTGDNGPHMGGGTAEPYRGGKLPGNTQYEGWVHVPTVAHWPGVIPKGATYDGLTCNMDYYATAAAAIGKPLPEKCDGVDLVPFLQGKQKGDAHEYLYWNNADPTDPPHRNIFAVRWKQWRLVRTKSTEEWKLFDIVKDPKEKNNVASANKKVVEALKKKHEEFAAALPPLIPSKECKGGKRAAIKGFGWHISSGK